MKFLIYLTAAIITVIIQVSIIPNLSIGGSFPNLVLIGSLILLFSNRQVEALWWTGAGGLFLDVFSPLRYGINTLLLIGIYFLIKIVINRFLTQPLTIVIAGSFFVCSVLMDLIPFFLSNGDWVILIKNASYNTFLGMAVYYLVHDKLKVKELGYRQ